MGKPVMRNKTIKWVLPLLSILLFTLWGVACACDNSPVTETVCVVTEPSAVPAQSVDETCAAVAVSSESIDSDSQAIILKTPTFQELKDFILKDPTSRNEFVLDQYECRHFAAEVNNNAEAAGLKCAFVLLCYERGQHAVIAFDTTDRGLVYIEPQSDAVIHPEVGGMYQEKEIKEILIAW